MVGQMDIWKNGWMNGWVGGQGVDEWLSSLVDEQMAEWVDGQMDDWVSRWMDGQMGGCVGRWMDEWMDRWCLSGQTEGSMDEQVDISMCAQKWTL